MDSANNFNGTPLIYNIQQQQGNMFQIVKQQQQFNIFNEIIHQISGGPLKFFFLIYLGY